MGDLAVLGAEHRQIFWLQNSRTKKTLNPNPKAPPTCLQPKGGEGGIELLEDTKAQEMQFWEHAEEL